MPKKYRLFDLQKMTIGELSELIGYDYIDFTQAGGTLRDALAIANGKKEIDEQLHAIRNRFHPMLVLTLAMFTFSVLLIIFYAVATAIRMPDWVILLLAFLLPILFIVWRSRSMNRKRR